MNRYIGRLAAFSILAAAITAACASRNLQPVVGSPSLSLSAPHAYAQPNVIPTIPPGVVTSFAIPTTNGFPAYITSAGGDLWFTENSANKIGRITTTGVITEFSAGSASPAPYDIITGPDGRPWFGAQTASALGRVAANGAVTLVPIPTASSHPEQLVADKAHNSIWFAERFGQKVGVYDLTTKTFTEYPVPAGFYPLVRLAGIALDASGNVWVTDDASDVVDELSSTGTLLQQITLPGATGNGFSLTPWYFARGTNGDLWLTEVTGGPAFKGAVVRIDPITNSITTVVPRGPNPSSVDIATGPKGLWLPPEGGSQLVRFTNNVGEKEWTIPGSGGYGIVEGPDRNMWYVDYVNNAIVQLKVSLLP